MTPHSRQLKHRRPHRHAAGSLAAVVAAIVLTTAAFAQSTKPAQAPGAAAERNKAEIVRVEKNWLHALQTHNVAELDRILAPDFVRPVPGSGTFITGPEMLAWLRTHPAPRALGARFEQLNVTLYGNAAIARGILATTNPLGRAVRKTLFTDVFLRRDGRWQAVSAQENNLPPPAKAKTRH
jgi:hypothetical protein